MLLGGDELGRTQGGNNNAYAQDNEVSWYDWDCIDPGFLGFVASLIALRRSHPVFHRPDWLRGTPSEGDAPEDIVWFAPDGNNMTLQDWQTRQAKAVMIFLSGAGLAQPGSDDNEPADDSFLLMLNANGGPIDFVVPSGLGVDGWQTVVDTVEPDAVGGTELREGSVVTVAAFGLHVMKQAVRL